VKIKRGTASKRRLIFIGDSSSTTGAGLANLVFNSAGLVAYYYASDLSNDVQITLVTATLGTYTSGGFIAVDNTNMPGWYEVGIPDAVLDGGVEAVIQFRGAANMVPVNLYIELDSVDYQDATAFGLSRLDAAVTSRMASYTQPTGFLAATFPATVASPTNITSASGVTLAASQPGVTIPTVTSVTNGVTVSTNNDKGGYSLTQSFPSNFSTLSIDGSGRVLLQPAQTGVTIPNVDTVQTVNELGQDALNANELITDIGVVVWQQLTTATWPDNSFGKQVLIGSSTQRSVAVTGSHHVASVLHDAEPNSIPEDAFVTGALSARALAADAATEIATAVGTLQVLTRLDSMIESDGAGQFRFDTIALENAPSGGGGGGGGTDWTSNERSAIRSILGFNSSGSVVDPSVGILDEIRDKTALITSGTVYTALPVTSSGQITSPLVIGDDYLAANGRAFSWTVALPTGFVAATASCRFGMRFEDETGVNSFVATGTVTDAGSGNVTLSFDVAKTVTGDLRPGWYDWSVEIVSASGVEVTRVKSGKNAEWQEKQT
jgi:hypothetical protein